MTSMSPFSNIALVHCQGCVDFWLFMFMYRRDKLLSPKRMGAALAKRCCAKECLRAFTVHQLQEERARLVAKPRVDHNNHIVTVLNSFKTVTTKKGKAKR
jgi:hypothetical protein